jgi:uncharacterized protein (TIGR02217 family)
LADFIEDLLYTTVRYGSSWQDDYSVNVVTTAGGQEYRSLIHAFPRRTFTLDYELDLSTMWPVLLDLYHRAHGTYAGFRALCLDEDSSNGSTGSPTAFDQPMLLISSGVYQLIKQYGTLGAAGASGYPYRRILKPQTASVLVGIGGTAITSATWSVNTTNGQVTFGANKAVVITGISKAAQAVINTTNTQGLVIGQSVHVSGVAGMTQINGLRALIIGVSTNVSITVAINSTAFSTYTSGGTANTNPQTGETVTAGFRFHFPVRFKSALPIGQDYPQNRMAEGVEFIELLNP